MRRALALLALAAALSGTLLPGTMARADEGEAERRQVLVFLPLPSPHARAEAQPSGRTGEGRGQRARRAVAGQLARMHGLKLLGSWPLPLLGVDCFVLAVPAARPSADVAEELAHDPRVAWAQPMNLYRTQGSRHDDPLYPLQPAAQTWQLAQLHELASGRGVKVAVVDSAVDARHPDLAGQVAVHENFVEGRPDAAAERHGTAVAGIIAARADDGIGIAGVAPRARLLALRACWQDGSGPALCTSLALAKAIEYATREGASVINLSLSGAPDRLLAALLDRALAHGTVVVAAHDPTLKAGGFPASHPGVVAVSDLATPGAFTAPGRDVPAPAPEARWDIVSGASYATAQVSGLFALLREFGAARASSLVQAKGGEIDTCATLLRATGPRECACALAVSAHAAAHP